MTWLFLFCVIVIMSFGSVIFFGAPYLPTLNRQIEEALELADLKAGQHLLELGCGDGKVLIAAARQGLKVTGYEINPFLAFVAWARTRRYRNSVTVIWGNFWIKRWPEADAIYVFLLQKFMAKLDRAIDDYPSKPLKLVSVAFTVPNKPIAKKTKGVTLYIYR